MTGRQEVTLAGRGRGAQLPNPLPPPMTSWQLGLMGTPSAPCHSPGKFFLRSGFDVPSKKKKENAGGGGGGGFVAEGSFET